jgi:hypothetical protein
MALACMYKLIVHKHPAPIWSMASQTGGTMILIVYQTNLIFHHYLRPLEINIQFLISLLLDLIQ